MLSPLSIFTILQRENLSETIQWPDWVSEQEERLKEASEHLNLIIIETSDIVISRAYIWLSSHVLDSKIWLIVLIPNSI